MVIAIPDQDVYEEYYDLRDGCLLAVRFCRNRTDFPLGIRQGDAYRFSRDPSDVELVGLMNAAVGYFLEVWQAENGEVGG